MPIEPAAIISAVALGLTGGVLLRRVVTRLPPMLEQQWRAEAAEEQGRELDETPIRFFGAAPRGSTFKYPVVEVAAVLIAAWAGWRFDGGAAVAAFVFAWGLLALAFIDARHTLLPDVLTMPLLWGGLGLAAAGYGFVTPPDAIFGAISGYVFMIMLAQVYGAGTGREGLAPGDFKMLAAIGAWVGAPALLGVVTVAFLSSSLIGYTLIASGRMQREDALPFGPYLAIGALVTLDQHAGVQAAARYLVS